MPEFRHILAATAIIATAAFTSPGAQAASQVLGLVASNGLPTPLQCEDGVCAGRVASEELVVDKVLLHEHRDEGGKAPRVCAGSHA